MEYNGLGIGWPPRFFLIFFGGSISEHLQLHFHLFSALVQRGTELFSLKLSIGYLIREYRLSIHPIESFNFHPKIPKSWMFSLWSNAHIHLSLPPALSRPMKTFTRWTFWKFPRYKGHKLKILWKVFSWIINIIIIMIFAVNENHFHKHHNDLDQHFLPWLGAEVFGLQWIANCYEPERFQSLPPKPQPIKTSATWQWS